ncbi:cobalamin biosynthesis protein [Paracoccus sp. Z330]|uniref:Cobalamin biosynthesis protein n=1 Tax=Paracoccus onchidii TaxID=3017813 RepID=A0ABT4ZCY9_9RHOB|nr:cobalamin biosynthesis protein [Paracoccus onchidii]MDB6177139.1 cobalamin biosynthesis protein [Paracoccus onchidii]
MRIAGIGCRKAAPPAALRDALLRALLQSGPVQAIATIPARKAELQALNLPLLLVEIAEISTPTQSPRIQRLYRTGSVAEAAALAACGKDGVIVVSRVISACGTATAAIAERPEQS